MTLVRWSEQASADLEAIHSYIARDSPFYASRTVEHILEAIDRLQHFPEFGRIVREFQRPDIRELIIGAYRVVYQQDIEAVGIVTIVHGARLRQQAPGAV